ncbi:stromal cell-derived factor 2-like protein [Cyclospora cayetanensis]|uniref:Stromal cell-derived factor 2-like protein n=1 Tax=Cyclospora cayetanensis TaxID=88456 RepID=A0A6P6S3P3_9EIME|nr:stromal cell-derived factor 2-like protein [Cyclospora cayetanensis]
MALGGRICLLACIIAAVCATNSREAQGAPRAVTYGSAIALVHEASGHKLYSGKISWGSGSVGQAVTAQPATDATASLWSVRAAALPAPSPLDPQQPAGSPPPTVGAGVPVRCGSSVVLEHVGSQALLRTGPAEAPLSPNHEVGAALVPEGRDSRFVVECTGDGDVWRVGHPVKLRNMLLGANLQASQQHAFSYSNCGRGCPIAGHLEVSVVRGRPSSWSWQQPADSWTAQPQLLFFAEGETEENGLHDEL